MRKLFIVLCILFPLLISAKEKQYESPMTIYKDNYFLAGDMDNQVKIQLSAKYNLFYKNDLNTGLYLGYTQLSNWICYEKRDTFITMYSPEVFYKFESANNIFNDAVIPFVDYVQVSPINHSSTGQEGDNHRGMNTYYGQMQLSIGDVFNFGLNGKYFRYYSMSNYNKDINDYKKNYEASVFIKVRSKTVDLFDKEEVHFKFGGNPRGKGFYCIQGQFRILTSAIQPKFMIEYYKGYDEFMMRYNTKTKSIRIGLVF
jgi:outer membrane phospholipase A